MRPVRFYNVRRGVSVRMAQPRLAGRGSQKSRSCALASTFERRDRVSRGDAKVWRDEFGLASSCVVHANSRRAGHRCALVNVTQSFQCAPPRFERLFERAVLAMQHDREAPGALSDTGFLPSGDPARTAFFFLGFVSDNPGDSGLRVAADDEAKLCGAVVVRRAFQNRVAPCTRRSKRAFASTRMHCIVEELVDPPASALDHHHPAMAPAFFSVDPVDVVIC